MKNVLLLFFSITVLFGCKDDHSSEPLSTVESQFNPQYYVSAINRSESSLFSVWDSIYQNYPMSVFCDCDCNASSIIQAEVNSRIVDYDGFSNFSVWDFTCAEFMDGIGATCGQEIAYTDSLCISPLISQTKITAILGLILNIYKFILKRVNRPAFA